MPFLAMVFAAVALDAAVADQSVSSVGAAAAAPATAAKERLVCHTEPVTGSHFGRKVCETPEEAKARREELRDALQRDRDQRPYDMPPPALDGQ